MRKKFIAHMLSGKELWLNLLNLLLILAVVLSWVFNPYGDEGHARMLLFFVAVGILNWVASYIVYKS